MGNLNINLENKYTYVLNNYKYSSKEYLAHIHKISKNLRILIRIYDYVEKISETNSNRINEFCTETKALISRKMNYEISKGFFEFSTEIFETLNEVKEKHPENKKMVNLNI